MLCARIFDWCVRPGWNTSGTAVNHTLNPDAGTACTTGHFRDAEFLEAPASRDVYLAKNSSGLPALESWSHCHVYDHANPVVRQYWTDMCLNMTATGYIDGCGADFSSMEQNDWRAHNTANIMKQVSYRIVSNPVAIELFVNDERAVRLCTFL